MDDDAHTELEATLAARRELGPAHDEHLAASFLDRIDKELDRRIDERLAHHRTSIGRPELGIFVPIFLFAGIFGGATGIMAAAAALAAVFVISELRR